MDGVRTSHEPDPERARRIAEDGCILRAVVGSNVLASSLPDEADRDAIDAFLVRAYEDAWRRR